LAAAGLAAARAMALADGDAALEAAFERRPHFRRPGPPPAPGSPDPAAAARFAALAARIDALVAAADMARFPAMAAEARRAAAAKDWKRAEELLKTPDFIVGGAEAGTALAGLGEGSEARARALARGTDPVLRDVGLGWLMALGGVAPGAQTQGRSR
jgi:hypothetical protein